MYLIRKFYLFLNKKLIQLSITDAASFLASKSLENTASIVDSVDLVAAFLRSLSDTADVSDEKVLSVFKQEADTVSIADVSSFLATKPLEDSASGLLDAVNLFTSMGVSSGNTVGATDSLAKSFSTSKQDSTGATDASVLLFNKISQDPVACTDAGLVLSQGYVSGFDYFASDYVGASATF